MRHLHANRLFLMRVHHEDSNRARDDGKGERGLLNIQSETFCLALLRLSLLCQGLVVTFVMIACGKVNV